MSTIVIAGGSGLLGTALVGALRADGHTVAVLTRRPTKDGDVLWAPGTSGASWTPVLDGADAVVNLAGASIAGGRWTAARKAAIRDSRLQATGSLVRVIAAARQPPATFISASAIGYYGVRGDEPANELTPPGSDFLANVCRDWEDSARRVPPSTRVVLLRSGVVFAREGGALPQLALPFRFFAGGRTGSGRQFVSWVHIADWVAVVKWALATPTAAGPVNVTAPTPVTNAELAQTLGRVLRRPAWLPAPPFALRLVLGEMADALILGGQRVLPDAARQQGFVFRYPALEPALADIYGRSR